MARHTTTDNPSCLPPVSLAWLTWGLLASLYFVGIFQRVAPAVMADELMRDFSITATLPGNLSVIYFYAYAAMQIPSRPDRILNHKNGHKQRPGTGRFLVRSLRSDCGANRRLQAVLPCVGAPDMPIFKLGI